MKREEEGWKRGNQLYLGILSDLFPLIHALGSRLRSRLWNCEIIAVFFSFYSSWSNLVLGNCASELETLVIAKLVEDLIIFS
jgi:hypothetical protein